jgi:hypothetical protein
MSPIALKCLAPMGRARRVRDCSGIPAKESLSRVSGGPHAVSFAIAVNRKIRASSDLRRAVEQAFRLPCRYSYRHSPKIVGTDAGVAT